MSPRSEEFLDAARRKLAAAAAALQEDPATAVSSAYYAMLYGARAALSERDTYAKAHAGTWHEFRRLFVETGQFNGDLAASAHAVQPERERADYDAWAAPADEAQRVIQLAGAFLGGIAELIG